MLGMDVFAVTLIFSGKTIVSERSLDSVVEG